MTTDADVAKLLALLGQPATPKRTPNMPQMHLLVGPIASGKTTWARGHPNALVVSDDAIATAVVGRYEYHEELKPLYFAIGAAVVTHAATLGHDVIIDTGCRTRDERSRWAALGRTLGFTVAAVQFTWESAAVHATRRFNADARGYTYDRWLQVARRHEVEYEPVAPWEKLT